MLKINKQDEPSFILDFKRKNSPKVWKDYDGKIKNEIKEFILKNEQDYYCAYCEKRIRKLDDSHIEHIKDRDTFANLFQSYDNIIVSCNEKNSCGMNKSNKYSDDFINPVLNDPLEYLDLNLASGEVVSKNNDESSLSYKRAKYTIEVLNLNYDKLKEARKALIDILQVYSEDIYTNEERIEYLQFFIDDGHDFPNVIKAFMEI